jgi:hypothetical protein
MHITPIEKVNNNNLETSDFSEDVDAYPIRTLMNGGQLPKAQMGYNVADYDLDEQEQVNKQQPSQFEAEWNDKRMRMTGESKANAINTGMDVFTSLLNRRHNKAYEDQMNNKMLAQNSFTAQQGSQGDYDAYGNMRPNQQVPVQFSGAGPTRFQEGGEYDLSDKEIQELIRQGYDIELI